MTSPTDEEVTIDLRAVMMEEIEEAAAQSPWVPPEYTMNEVTSDCCAFLRENRPDPAKVQTLVDEVFLAFENVDSQIDDDGEFTERAWEQLRAAIAALKEAAK